jgi:hypothetical protein
MDQGLVKTALRVLSAYLEFTEPDPADVRVLRKYLPTQESWQPDELACLVVQNELCGRSHAIELDRARAEWLAATAEMNETIREVPSGLPHPDGRLSIARAGEKRAAAFEKYLELLRREQPSSLRFTGRPGSKAE